MNIKKYKIIVIDFYDSFTWNIVSEINHLLSKNKLNISLEVSSWENINLNSLCDHTKLILIWGPGPGVPDDYKTIYPVIDVALKSNNIFNMGICLGHQLLLVRQGHELIRSKRAKHGESINLIIPENNQFDIKLEDNQVAVQLYNSWVIEKKHQRDVKFNYLEHDNEIMGHICPNSIGYQFHPESVGTSCREAFFLPILKYLYNE